MDNYGMFQDNSIVTQGRFLDFSVCRQDNIWPVLLFIYFRQFGCYAWLKKC